MSIKIDSQMADAMTLRLATGFGNKDIVFDLALSDFSWTEEIWDQLPPKMQESALDICGERGFGEFVYGEVARTIDEQGGYFSAEEWKLSDLDSFSDTITAARDIVSRMKALPYTYRIAVPLPKAFTLQYSSVIDDGYELAPGISIIPGRILDDNFPTSTGFISLDDMFRINSGEDVSKFDLKSHLFLVQYASGYIGRQREAPVYSDFITTVRQFLGACLAAKTIEVASWPKYSIEAPIFSHKRDDRDFSLAGIEQLGSDIQQLYAKFREVSISARWKSREKDLLKGRLDSVASVFARSDHGKRLSVASLWYLRSHISQDSLDGLLESTIALEALLGGSGAERTKLSDLLGNRCAFLIGKSITDRQNILSKFTEIYSLRSKIVHEGHHKFTMAEKGLLSYARDLCGRALMKEMQLSKTAQ